MAAKIKMANFGSPKLEKFPKIKDKAFFHSSNSYFQEIRNFKKKTGLVTKIQNSDQKPIWRQIDTYSLKNRLERHRSRCFKTHFVRKMLSIGRKNIFSH
jgi:hypothetical protein